MSYPTCATSRTGSPVFDSYSSPASLSTQSTRAVPKMTLQQLRDSARPPCDDNDFTLPEKSAGDNRRLKKFSNYNPSTYLGHMIYMEQLKPPKVTREAVLNFLNDGVCPQVPLEFKALTLFLLTNKLFGALAWLLVRSDTNMLALDNCNLGNEGAAKVAEWIKTLPFQVKINLQHNEISLPGAALLADALASNTVVELKLGFNALGDEGVQRFCAGLLQNASMQSLDLRHVGAGCAGMRAIALVLYSHPSLSVLSLDSNAFDDDTAAVFAIALGDSKILTELGMHNFYASDIAISLVGGALKVNTALKSMSISGAFDAPNDQLIDALVDALLTNRTLVDLDLLADGIADAALKKLASAVEKNTALKRIGLNLLSHEDSSETAAVSRQIQDKVKANALIEAAGNALSDMSRRPEWTVPVPDEVGQSIAAFVAQVAADRGRKAAMKSIVEAGPLGSKNALGQKSKKHGDESSAPPTQAF